MTPHLCFTLHFPFSLFSFSFKDVNRIRILPDQVANQIAAGEVIERPASVLKELVENAIDAQAARIRVEIRGGGKSLIRVSDNGHGMGRDDALLCLERHGTSKIRDSADIGAIHTLGFRGEAIPSIASVSRFRLLTREEGVPSGVELDVHGGKLLSVKDAGCVVGSQVEVRNLFYNMPARRKFLRSDATELGHIHHVFLLHALAQPSIAWTLQQDDRTIHELSPSASPASRIQNQQEPLLQRVRALYGPQLAAQLVPVDFTRDGARLHGLTGKPGLSRSNRSELYCFVNARPVDSRAIYYGLIEAYHTSLMRGRYPVCFLFLEIDPARVDVNIHPAKREVRFREDSLVQGIVIEAVRQALGKAGGQQSSPPQGDRAVSGQRLVSGAPTVLGFQAKPVAPLEMTIPSAAPQTSTPNAFGAQIPDRPSFPVPPDRGIQHPASSIQHSQFPISDPKSENASAHPSSFIPHPSTSPVILGVFANLYVVAMDSNGLLIVDQHAAHERILFEQMMARLSQGSSPSQKLLLPQTVELPPKDSANLRAQIPLLEKMGFGIAEFGERSFIIDAQPPWVRAESLPQLIRSILDELNEAGHKINRDRLAEETVAKTVCRHAVKANDILRPEELQRMLLDLQACANPLTCPHGRPTMLRLTQAELERKFGRRPMREE